MKRARTIYYYDGTLEGMLHAVAAAAKAAVPVDGVYAAGSCVPLLFDRCVHFQTDRDQAHRLFTYLKKLGDKAPLYALNGYLSENCEAATHLLQMVQARLAEGLEVLGCYTNDSVRFLDRLSQRVGFEAHRFNGLIRFHMLNDGLLYAPFEPDCNIIGYCAGHFQQRLKNQRWMLHDIRRDQAMFWEGCRLQECAVDPEFTSFVRKHGELPESHLDGEERYYQQLWRSFHTSIANPNRENTCLQKQRMPKRYWKYLVEMNSSL